MDSNEGFDSPKNANRSVYFKPFEFNRSTFRGYDLLVQYLLFQVITYRGGMAVLNKLNAKSEPNIVLACRAKNQTLVLTTSGFDESIHTGIMPDVITIGFRTGIVEDPNESTANATALNGYNYIYRQFLGMIFSQFTELANNWVRANQKRGYHDWPPISNFCRVVRNAIIHGGTINLSSPNSAIVRWAGITISHKNDGEQILSKKHLTDGDLIALMLELDVELEGLGAPRSLI